VWFVGLRRAQPHSYVRSAPSPSPDADLARADLQPVRSSTLNDMGRILSGTVLLIAALAACNLQAEATSVFGRALRRDGSNPPGPCRAILRAEVDRRGAPDTNLEGEPDGKTTFSVPLDQSGYFQFIAVPTSRYLLSVECPAGSGVRELSVQAGRAIRVDPPLILEDLALEVVITPKVDPDGHPWQLTVDATMPRLRRIADKSTARADGHWARRGLVAGNYRVSISRSDGTPWLQRFFNLSAESGPLRLQLPFMRVSGQVRLSTQPVHARLVFHNEAGGEPATLVSDDSGFFQGLLPVTPSVEETKWTVEARATNPPISRRLAGLSVQTAGETNAWLDLALPLFAVHGTVVSEAGKPQSNASVTVEEIDSGVRAATATDDAGGFELQDLPPGKYTALAESVEGVSKRTPFLVVEGTESEVKLVLNPSEHVPFYVVSSQGPVAEATVQVWIPPGVPRWFTRTGPDGSFDLKLPPGTTEVGMTVGARGYALKLTRLEISRDRDNSSDTNTVTLDTDGGRLVLDLHPAGYVLDSSMTPYLVHKGAIEAVGTLLAWGSNQADGSGRGLLAVEPIEPGAYSLCMVVDSAELAALWVGIPPSNRCRTGSVEQGRTLTLSPP